MLVSCKKETQSAWWKAAIADDGNFRIRTLLSTVWKWTTSKKSVVSCVFGFWTHKLNHNVKASHNHYHCQNVEQFNLNCSEMAETQPLTLYILYQIRNRQTKSRTHFRVGVHPITPQVHFWFTISKYEYVLMSFWGENYLIASLHIQVWPKNIKIPFHFLTFHLLTWFSTYQ